jgi:hypothetical protein
MNALFCFIILLACTLNLQAQQTSSLNPDIGVVGNFKLSKSSGNELKADLGEIELNLKTAVDPYSNAVLTIAFGEEGAEVEEGYLNITDLPFDLQAKVGRMRLSFNRINQFHKDVLPFNDLPVYLTQQFSEAGLIKDGVELSYILPTSVYSEFKLGGYSGNVDTSFSDKQMLTSFRWRSFFDLGNDGGVDVGASYLTGINNNGTVEDRYQTDITGLDLRVKKGVGLNRYVMSTNEWLFGRQDTGSNKTDTTGSFHYLGFNWDKQWQAGIGFNHSQSPDTLDTTNNHFYSLVYKWTEFQQYKVEYSKDDSGNQSVIVGLTYFLGPHKIHEF